MRRRPRPAASLGIASILTREPGVSTIVRAADARRCISQMICLIDVADTCARHHKRYLRDIVVYALNEYLTRHGALPSLRQ